MGEVRDRMFQCVVGSGKYQRVVLPTGQGTGNKPHDLANGSLEGDRGSAESKAGDGIVRGGLQGVRGQCNLQYACKCLQNVLFLLANTAHGGDKSRLPVTSTLMGSKTGMMTKESAEGGGSAAQSGSGPGADGEGDVGPSGQDNGPAAQEQDEALLERVALLNLSYVNLCLREPVLALRHAQSLLALPGVSEAHQYIARNYAAEACCMLNRSSEAITFLRSETNEAGALEAASMRTTQKAKDGASVGSSSPAEENPLVVARTGFCVNLASVYALEGNLAGAEDAVKAALQAGPTRPEALRMLIWVLLRKGRTAEALEVLKHRRAL